MENYPGKSVGHTLHILQDWSCYLEGFLGRGLKGAAPGEGLPLRVLCAQSEGTAPGKTPNTNFLSQCTINCKLK